MELNVEIGNIMKRIHSLSLKGKLEIMNRLSIEIQSEMPSGKKSVDKNELVEKLYGSWKDMDEEIADDIVRNRTISKKEINLDS